MSFFIVLLVGRYIIIIVVVRIRLSNTEISTSSTIIPEVRYSLAVRESKSFLRRSLLSCSLMAFLTVSSY